VAHAEHKDIEQDEPIGEEKLLWWTLESYWEKGGEEDESYEAQYFCRPYRDH